MAEIVLPKGQVVLVDETDLPLISKSFWRVDRYGYAQLRDAAKKYRDGSALMHRIIMGAKEGEIVDHRDNNRLNNQRSNLRIATKSQNGCNTMKKPGTVSKYKGVTKDAGSTRWRASIVVNQKRKHLGCFDTEDEAGHAYNKAAVELHGEFACLNPIGEDYVDPTLP